MVISLGDRLAHIGAVISTLQESCDPEDFLLHPESTDGFAVGRRYLLENEVVRVTEIRDGGVLAVARGQDSAAQTHLGTEDGEDGEPIYAVQAMLSVENVSRLAGMLGPVLPATDDFLHLPARLTVNVQTAQGDWGTPQRIRGRYQEDGGSQVVVQRAGLDVVARLGLVVLPRAEGGHWEVGVRAL